MNQKILVVKSTLILVLSMIVSIGYAQNWKDKTNTAYLKNLSQELDMMYQEYKLSVETYAFERDIQVRQVLNNGNTVTLIRILPSGIPEYYTTNNQKASENVGTSKLRPRADLSKFLL